MVGTHIVGGIDDESLKKELGTCKHFPLESEMENGRHKVFTFAMDILDALTFSQKLDTVFDKLKCPAKLNVAFGWLLKNVGNEACWYINAHEYNTLMEQPKQVATREDLIKIKNVLSNTDVIEACTKERGIRIGISTNSQM